MHLVYEDTKPKVCLAVKKTSVVDTELKIKFYASEVQAKGLGKFQ